MTEQHQLTQITILNMIVKDEAAVIERCLKSALPFFDVAVIVDTGSTDDTIERIKAFMRANNRVVYVHERPWVNFAHNRNEALQLAREWEGRHKYPGTVDYILFIDADEVFVPNWLPDDDKEPYEGREHEGYTITCNSNGFEYQRNVMVRSNVPFYWKGAVHEYLECDVPHQWGRMKSASILVAYDGARSKDPDKYAKDADMLLDEHLRDPTNTRTVFYLAQSYKDAGQIVNAIDYYNKRAEMPGFEEEGWYAAYQAASLSGSMPDMLTASERRPWRAEPFLWLARHNRVNKQFDLAVMFAERASHTSYQFAVASKKEVLFLDRAAYTYGWKSSDELLVSAYYARTQPGRLLQQALRAAKSMHNALQSDKVPAHEVPRMRDNMRMWGAKYREAKSPLYGTSTTRMFDQYR